LPLAADILRCASGETLLRLLVGASVRVFGAGRVEQRSADSAFAVFFIDGFGRRRSSLFAAELKKGESRG
jgi:hypothetical protein